MCDILSCTTCSSKVCSSIFIQRMSSHAKNNTGVSMTGRRLLSNNSIRFGNCRDFRCDVCLLSVEQTFSLFVGQFKLLFQVSQACVLEKILEESFP